MVRLLPKNWLTPELLERFWSQVDIKGPDDCWEWKNGLDRGGYGKFAINKRKKLGAHRVAYMSQYGEVVSSVLICHSCDNRKCCNPKHLWPGDHKKNSQDMLAKGRASSRLGEHLRILTADQVLQIRRRYLMDNVTMNELADEYGVKRLTVQSLISGRTWKNDHPVCTAPATRRLIRWSGKSVYLCDEHSADPTILGEFECMLDSIPGKKCCFVKE